MAITDDTLQDEMEVLCGKAHVYQNHMPEHVTESQYCSDGAACFSSKLNHIVQPLWKAWARIEEVECRITPAGGGGKDSLDAQFGVFGRYVWES
jgi:hypothetical protein